MSDGVRAECGFGSGLNSSHSNKTRRRRFSLFSDLFLPEAELELVLLLCRWLLPASGEVY